MYIIVRSQRATARTLQNVSEVNREHSRLAAASSVCDSTKHKGLVTLGIWEREIRGKSHMRSVYMYDNTLCTLGQDDFFLLFPSLICQGSTLFLTYTKYSGDLNT